jgi:hypothetical protein
MMLRWLLLAGLFLPGGETHAFHFDLTPHIYDGSYEGRHPQGWDGTVIVPQSPTHISTVTISLEQSSTAMWGYENFAPVPSTGVILRRFDRIEVTSGGHSLVSVCVIRPPERFDATAFDGTWDFGGTSGFQAPWDWRWRPTEIEITEPALVALFVGTDETVLDLRGRSDFEFESDAGSYVYGAHFRTGLRGSVTYD